MSFDVRNDAMAETKFIAVDYKRLTRGKVEMDRFFGTKEFSTIEIQSIHANECFKALSMRSSWLSEICRTEESMAAESCCSLG